MCDQSGVWGQILRVFEQGRQSGTGGPLRIAVIGSCRVHDPFEDLADAGKLLRVWANNQVSPYTLGEVCQIIQYTRMEKEIPSEFVPFIFENIHSFPVHNAMQQQMINNIDAFIVEISDFRQFVCDDIYFQFNYFWREFISHYGAAVMPWYQAFSRGLEVGEDVVVATLSKIEASGTERALVERILRRTRIEELDVGEMAACIERIRFKPQAEWVFVSHFVVPGVEGTLMSDRKKLRERLRAATTACGAQMFDPSEIIARHGREVALAKEGRDVYHYNPSFQAVIAEDLLGLVNRLAGGRRRFAFGPAADRAAVGPQAAARLNELLVPFYRDRMQRLGVDESGLYSHYENLITRGEIISLRELQITDLIINFLPAYSRCHVLKAGLGEIALLLSGAGLVTLATEPNDNRRAAILAAHEFLQRQGVAAAERLEITEALIPDREDERRILAVATQFGGGYSPEQEEALLKLLERYHGVVFDPRIFMRRRETLSEQDAFTDQMRHHGFGVVRAFPALDLVYCAKSEIWSETEGDAPHAETAAARGGKW